jgi:hypothetical protein
MSLVDKYNIIENHTQNEDKEQVLSKVSNYFENLINTEYKTLLTDYISMLTWFNHIDKTKASETINMMIKDHLIQRRNNMRSVIKKDNFELSKFNNFLQEFIIKLEYINNIITSVDDHIIKHGIKELSNLIISDSLIFIFIENELVTFNKDIKVQIEVLLKFCKRISKYDNSDTFNKLIKSFGNVFKKQIINITESILPENIKRIQKLSDMIRYCNKVNNYFEYIKEYQKDIIYPIINSLVENLVEIIKFNPLSEVAFVITNLWLSVYQLLNKTPNMNDHYTLLSTEITKLIGSKYDLNLTNLDYLLGIITHIEPIINTSNHGSVIYKTMSDNFTSDSIQDTIHHYIDKLIREKIIDKVSILFGYYINIKNKDEFINIYYQELTKRLMEYIINNDNFNELILNEEMLLASLKNKFSMKLLYKIDKIINDTKTSFADNTDFNKLLPSNALAIMTTSYGNWDINMTEGIVDAKMLSSLKDTIIGKQLSYYMKYYDMRYSNKKTLVWFPHFGEVSIIYCNINFIMLPIQFMVMELFENTNSIPCNVVKKSSFLSNYTTKFVNDIIMTFTSSGLFKIHQNDMILNDNIKSSDVSRTNLIELFFSNSDYAEVWDQKREDEFAHSRVEITNTIINKILKITCMNKDDLFKKVKDSITIFELDHNIFDKSLEFLIKGEYIVLNKNDMYEKIFY